jgi:DNA-binding transcriptional regulator YhcF (GntR family)
MPDRHAVDPQSAVPLYHQIAEEIRGRIESGQLAPGETLEPLRLAAERWGVNLHTVRHAYAALAREGLVDVARGPAGTRVSGRTREIATKTGPVRTDPDRALRGFLDRVSSEAGARFGLGAAELARLLSEHAAPRAASSPPLLYAVECSEWQCVAHARELAARYEVDARPWPLSAGEPPAGAIVATYFHYNDIRRAWPRRFGSAHFVTIRPDPMLRARLEEAGGDVLVCERDYATAEAVIGDLEAMMGASNVRFVAQVAADPERELARQRERPILFPPRVWAQLSERSRRDPRAIEVIYRFDERELDAIARTSGWRPAGIARAS